MTDVTRQNEQSAAEKLGETVSGDIPVVYTNGFSIGLTNADVVLVWARSNRPIQTVHMSYRLAKTLHLKLAAVVKEFEKAVDKKLLTTDDVDKLIQKGGKK